MSLQLLKCPNCSASIPKVPERKTKCNSCGKFYRRRNHPNSPAVYKIVTEEEALEIDLLWSKINNAHVTIHIDRKNIIELYKKLDQVRGLIETCSLFGSISVADENYNIMQIEEMESELLEELRLETYRLKERWSKI